MRKKNKKIKEISELSNKDLKKLAVITSDSALLYDALFDTSDEGIIEIAKEISDEIENRKKNNDSQ